MRQQKKELEPQQEAAEVDDRIAIGKGYVCAVCSEPLPKELWGEMLCSYHQNQSKA